MLIEEPLRAVESTNPNMNARKRKCCVKLRAILDRPTTIKPIRITFRPSRSKRCPKNGWARPLTRKPAPPTPVMAVRLHPNSWLMGITKMPKLVLTPTAMKAMKVTVATMYQP